MALLKGNWSSYGRILFGVPEHGIEFKNTNQRTKDSNGGSRVVTVSGECSYGVEVTQGTLNVSLTRGTGSPWTSALWGGAEDMACRINVYNSSASTTSYGGMQGLRVYARQYSGGNMANIYSAKFDADDRGTSDGAASCAVIQTVTVSQRINGIAKTTANILVVEDNSQGSITPTTCTGTAMIKIRSTMPVATGARASAIHFETTGSGTGWTNAFSFQTATGLEGFTSIADGTQGGNAQGYIKVYDVAGTQTLYIPLYDAAPTAS